MSCGALKKDGYDGIALQQRNILAEGRARSPLNLLAELLRP